MKNRFSRSNVFSSIVLSIIFIFLVTQLSGIEAEAQLNTDPGNIKLGPFYVTPSLLIKETYTDNLFYDVTDGQDDFKTILSPGIKLLLKPLKRHSILLAYEGTFTRHADFSSEDTDDHRADALIELDFTGGLNIKAWDTFTKDHEPRRYSPTGEIEEFYTNVIAASASYELSKRFKIKADYINTNYNFESEISNFRDRKEDTASGTLFYRFLPKTSFLLEYDFTRVKYDHETDLDSDVTAILGGIKWEVTEKMTGTIKAGYLMKDFESSVRNDFDGVIFSLAIDHQFTEFTSIRLMGERRINETNIVGPDYSTITEGYGEFTQRLTNKISGVINGSYGVEKYNKAITAGTVTDIREDRVWNAGAGLRYQIQKWWEIGLDYLHRNRDSNFNIFDYKENAYSLFMKFVY